MPFEDIWNVVKPFVEFGIVGVLLYMMIRQARQDQRYLTKVLEDQVERERQHAKEKLQMERDCARQYVEMLKQVDMTMATVESTLASLVGGN